LAAALLALAACSSPPATENNVQTDTATATPGVSTGTNTASTDGAAIRIDGSSTVFPLTDEVANELKFEKADEAPNIEVNFSGTTAGFRRFCASETDISNASRPINKEEIEVCSANGVQFIELPVAFDAVTLSVHPSNTWAESMTVEELKTVWEPAAEGQITQWNQIRPDWPAQPIELYGPGEDSGTFDFFTEAIVGESRSSRKDFTASEDDTELVRGIRSNPNSLGYFGLAYYEENQRFLNAVAIDSGNGPVVPSSETVRSGQYQPLSRPLFIYVNAESAKRPEVKMFVEYYLTNAPFLANVVGYVPLPEEAYGIARDHFINNRVGTVFKGESTMNMTIEQLLKEEASF
jgi:phosphate transport system substrate-binding protein